MVPPVNAPSITKRFLMGREWTVKLCLPTWLKRSCQKFTSSGFHNTAAYIYLKVYDMYALPTVIAQEASFANTTFHSCASFISMYSVWPGTSPNFLSPGSDKLCDKLSLTAIHTVYAEWSPPMAGLELRTQTCSFMTHSEMETMRQVAIPPDAVLHTLMLLSMPDFQNFNQITTQPLHSHSCVRMRLCVTSWVVYPVLENPDVTTSMHIPEAHQVSISVHSLVTHGCEAHHSVWCSIFLCLGVRQIQVMFMSSTPDPALWHRKEASFMQDCCYTHAGSPRLSCPCPCV